MPMPILSSQCKTLNFDGPPPLPPPVKAKLGGMVFEANAVSIQTEICDTPNHYRKTRDNLLPCLNQVTFHALLRKWRRCDSEMNS